MISLLGNSLLGYSLLIFSMVKLIFNFALIILHFYIDHCLLVIDD